MFGKVASDLQNNVVVGANSITGHLNYVDDYTGFSSNPAEQEGNYIVLHAEVPNVDGVTITITNTMTATLDEDGIYVGRIADKDSQTLTVVASKTGYDSVTKVYTLSGLEVDSQ